MSTSGELKSSPRYGRIVATSRQIAWDLGHRYVGVEHLFLAVVDDPDAVPTQVLSRFVDRPRLALPYVTSSRRTTGVAEEATYRSPAAAHPEPCQQDKWTACPHPVPAC